MRYACSVCFLPTDYVERKTSRRVNAVCAVLFLTVMLGIGTMMMRSMRALSAAQAEHEQIDRAFAEAAERVEQIREMQTEQARLNQLARGAAAISEKMPRSYVLAEITNSLPPGVALVDLNLDSAAAAQPSEHAPLVTLRITGDGDSNVQVSQFVNALSRSKILKNVYLTSSNTKTNAATGVADSANASATSVAASKPIARPTTVPSEASRFVVEMTLDPNAALLGPEPKMATSAIELKPE